MATVNLSCTGFAWLGIVSRLFHHLGLTDKAFQTVMVKVYVQGFSNKAGRNAIQHVFNGDGRGACDFDGEGVVIAKPVMGQSLQYGFFFPGEIKQLIKQGAVFYCSHSGGKDSQAMYHFLIKNIPSEQVVVVVHASLGEVEWPGVIEHIEKTIRTQLHVVSAKKTFLGMVENRGMWPSSAYRQCTSDLKRGPIMKFIRNDLKAKNKELAINCMGLRAEESTARSKRTPFCINKNESVNGRVKRTVYDWLPIFHLSTQDIFNTIEHAQQKPFWAYGKAGELNGRLSCVFCIMGSRNDLRHGATRNPELYRKYVELERRIKHTMFMKDKKPIWLEDFVGIPVVQIDEEEATDEEYRWRKNNNVLFED